MKKNISAILLIMFLSTAALLPALDVPALKGYVNDYAGIISSSDEQEIESLMRGLESSTTAQGAILTIPSLEGESIESFSIKAAEKWQLGQKGEDNGFLIVLALAEKKVRIEVGYGLEGLLTDAKSGFIIREIMIPEFKKGNYVNGLYQGAYAAAGIVAGTEDIPKEKLASGSSSSRRSGSGIPFNFIIFIIFVVLSGATRRGRRGGLLRALFWGSVISSSTRHHRGGFGGGSFGGGGFGGGGFSGGGGGFGGGGASGGW